MYLRAELGKGAEGGNRALERKLVEEGQAHAALVFNGDRAMAWCEFGTPDGRTSTTARGTRQGWSELRNTCCTRVWIPAVKVSGVDFNVGIDDFRHAHASWLLAGAPTSGPS